MHYTSYSNIFAVGCVLVPGQNMGREPVGSMLATAMRLQNKKER